MHSDSTGQDFDAEAQGEIDQEFDAFVEVDAVDPGSQVELNPQPLPPGEEVALSPQPLPPEPPGEAVSLNPKPLPPEPDEKVALNPQPLPPRQGIGGLFQRLFSR